MSGQIAVHLPQSVVGHSIPNDTIHWVKVLIPFFQSYFLPLTAAIA